MCGLKFGFISLKLSARGRSNTVVLIQRSFNLTDQGEKLFYIIIYTAIVILKMKYSHRDSSKR